MDEQRLEILEGRIANIDQRNKKVEAEKAWEGSFTRISIISIITYIFACFILLSLGNKNFYFSALLPTLGFILSTQSLPFIKKWWINKHIQ